MRRPVPPRKCVLTRDAIFRLDSFAPKRDILTMLTEQAIHFRNQAIRQVRSFRAKSGWSLNKLAKRAGLRESTIRNIDDPEWNPEFETLKKLEILVTQQGAR